jgi:hypothetical protein
LKGFVERCAMIRTAEIPFPSAFGGDHGCITLFVTRVVRAFSVRGVDLYFVFDAGRTHLEHARAGRPGARSLMSLLSTDRDEKNTAQLAAFFSQGKVGDKLPYQRLRVPLCDLQRGPDAAPVVPDTETLRHWQGAEAGERLLYMMGSDYVQPLPNDPSSTARDATIEALRAAVPAAQLLLASGDDDYATARLVARLINERGREAVIGLWSDDTDFFTFGDLADVPILNPDDGSLLAAFGWRSANYWPPISPDSDLQAAATAAAQSAVPADPGPVAAPDDTLTLLFAITLPELKAWLTKNRLALISLK